LIKGRYGTGTPEEAAGWVRFANILKGYGVKYWSGGNENYGNGHYGASWEVDNHPDKSAGIPMPSHTPDPPARIHRLSCGT